MRTTKLAITAGLLLAAVSGFQAASPSAATEPATHASAPAAGLTATLLFFEEQEAGIEPYRTRFIVTERYLRIDDGTDGEDFILLDRLLGRIYNVTPADRSILVIERKPREVASPLKLDLSQTREPLQHAPRVAGREAEHHAFHVNGERCYDVVSVPGLMEPVVAAMREYRLVLVSEHKRVLPHIPANVHQACDLAHNIFAPVRHLGFGLPIQEWSPDGYRRSLLDFELGFRAEPALFRLPEGYRRYTMGMEP